jgi:DNA-binding CsgD family transcriptional regulator
VSDAGAYSGSRARIADLCRSGRDARTVRLHVIEELGRVVGFDAYAWLLTDPTTSVGVSPLADVPWLAELPEQIRLKYLSPVNRWTALGDASVAVLHEATGGDLSQSLVWQELLVRYGVRDAASVVFQDRFGCWAFLELWRSGAADAFSHAEAAFLAELVEPLTLALRRCQASTFAIRPQRNLPSVGPVVLVLSPQLQVRGQTPETLEYLRVLVPPETGHQPVPAAAYNVAAQLLATEAGVDSNPPSARVHLADSRWMTVRAARIDGSGPRHERDIAVTIEETSAAQRVDLFARACGLSDRERELLEHLAAGNDTREVARQMFVSQHTVQDHLKSVFDKTATHSRRTLLARALGS